MKRGCTASKILALAAAALLHAAAQSPEPLAAGVTLVPGAINGVRIEKDGQSLAIYGDPRPKAPAAAMVLFTHHRRDVAWAGRALVAQGAQAVGPAAEADYFSGVADFWQTFRTKRFHDYANQSSRILAEPIPLARAVRGGDTVDFHGLAIHVVDTPGYTRGAVSYLFDTGGERIACTGDLIYGDGKILDLFSFQDAIPAVKEDGYHGWAARAGDLVTSLRKIADAKPDVLIPARGPVIRNPQQAIDTLISRLQAAFASHFAIDALRWYRGDEKIKAMAARVLGSTPITWMPTAEKVEDKLPDWIIAITNSRLIVSRTGAAFLVDCGNRRVTAEVKRLLQEGKIKHLDGIYITHYHDDHTNEAQALATDLHCPVYFCREMRDILEHPEAYRMPCLTPNPIHDVHPMEEGAKQRWNEFEFTYSYFPGQTIYHGGLLARRDDGSTILFVGDSFTPSGIDDYSLLNRNFFPPEKGFLDCLRAIRNLTGDYLLINEHVAPAFRFSRAQLDFMIDTFEKRRPVIADLIPWDDANYAVDENWARFYPYTAEVAAGGHVSLQVILRNHSPQPREFRVTPHAPAGWTVPAPLRVTIPARQERQVSIPVTAASSGLHLVTADISSTNMDLREWTEALITVR